MRDVVKILITTLKPKKYPLKKRLNAKISFEYEIVYFSSCEPVTVLFFIKSTIFYYFH